MKRITSIQLKASLLLLLFSMNTVVNFACAVGTNLEFNNHHQNDVAVEQVHVHDDTNHHNIHKTADKHAHESNKTQNKEDNGCCSNEVLKFQNLDKALNYNSKIFIDVPLYVVFTNNFLDIEIFTSTKIYPLKYTERYFYPPPQDIRIAIQSFQI